MAVGEIVDSATCYAASTGRDRPTADFGIYKIAEVSDWTMVKMFEIFTKNTLVGHSLLEFGDPPMGVAFGRFIAVGSYRQIQRECQTNHADQSRLGLTVRTAEGVQISCAGVGILDFSDQFAGESADYIEVNVLGIAYPPYDELFPEQVLAYEKQWGAR